jgi:murein DD-endopeptidase MepM/ murein hydrolase activator NlpD
MADTSRIMGDSVVARPPIVAGVLGILLAAGGAAASPSGSSTGASARAVAIRVVSAAGGSGTRELVAPPRAVQFASSFVHPADGSVLRTGSITANVSATSETAKADASASVDVSGISLFGGEVTVARVLARASARAESGKASGDASRSVVSGLTVLGQAAAASPGARVALGDWGYALVLVQGASPGENGHRAFVTALEVHLTADHGGLPAGTSVLIGYAEAAAAAEREARPPPPPTTTPDEPPALSPDDDRLDQPGEPREPGPPPIRPVPTIEPKLTREGYVFPVYGTASFGPSFRAPRAHVSGGWHHGVDIFAPFGAPVLAVADGTLFQVGWNDIGGNRLWLRDRDGNEFYYAHLSAYSPLAVDGARVRAGDVIAFVGTTGDAEGTPPHLHFEIHPVGLLSLGYDGVIDPYPYLLAWQRLEDVRFAGGSRWLTSVAPASDAPTPGAFLLSASDISSVSGLDPTSLGRALAPQSASVEAAFVASVRGQTDAG